MIPILPRNKPAARAVSLLFALALAIGILPTASAVEAAEEGAANLDVTLLVEGKRFSETWINVSAGGALIEIPATAVVAALQTLVGRETILVLESRMTPTGTLTNKILARSGITLSLDVPVRQVNLSVTKIDPQKKTPAPGPSQTAATASPVRAGPGAGAGQPAVPSPAGAGSGGPWTSPAIPALPGEAGVSSDTQFPSNVDAAPAKPSASQTGVAALDGEWQPVPETPPDTAAVRAVRKPKVELQSYRLDKTRDELFEDVFGHKAPPLPASVEVTLLVDGKSHGTLWILYNNEQKKYTFPVDPVLNALQGLVRRDLWEKLAERAKARTRFTVEDLIACGFPTVLNTTVFELSTGVPAQLLGSKIHPMSVQPVDPYTVSAYEPSGISGFINTRIRERLPYYQYNSNALDSGFFGRSQVDARNQNPRSPLVSDFDGAINVKSWVLEGKAVLLEQQKGPEPFDARRQDLRLVHDWPRRALRLNIGDLIFPTSGFQSFLNMGGIGLSRDFSLQPHLVAYPVKEYEFFLTDPSEVKVYINGTLRGTYQLEQGTHDLKGFPFTAGESEVEIQITDNTGRTQTLNFDFIHEPSLLAKGNSAFSFNVGLPSRDINNAAASPPGPDRLEFLNYEYDAGHPALFLDYKRGVSNTLTLEAYSQAMDTAGMLGIGFLRAIPIGKIKSDLAGSYHHEDRFAWAGNFEYTYIPKITSSVSPISWRLRTEYIGEDFFRPGQDSTLLGSLSFAGYFQKNAQLVNVNLGASYSIRPEAPDFYDFSAGLSRSWSRGWSSSLSFKNTFDRLKYTNTSVAATANYFFNLEEQNFNASERVETHRPDANEKQPPPDWDYSTDLMWDYNGGAPFPHNPALNASASFGPISNDFGSRAQWNGNQGTAEIMGRRYEQKNSSIISNYVDLTLHTAFVFAGGNFALSRPVRNSFVMVKGVENEKACDILVNSNVMGYDAKASNWLPGVVPNISPYYLKKIHVDVVDPPLGSNDERTDFTIYPGYKSGYVIYMGSKSTIIALGTLMLDSDRPAEYQTFQAIPLDGDSRDPVSAFTNKAGKFQLTRMQPGKYRIEMSVDGKAYVAQMNLPKSASGIKAVGTLVMAPK